VEVIRANRCDQRKSQALKTGSPGLKLSRATVHSIGPKFAKSDLFVDTNFSQKECLIMRKFACALATLAFLLTVPSPTFAEIQLQRVVSGLSSPLFVTNAHDGSNRLFILEQGGIIKVLQPGGTTPTVFLNITSKVVSGGEQGLLGLAFHPQYPANPRFYVDYTRAGDGATVIAQYQVSSDPNVANPTETVLLVIAQPFANHNGGMLAFGRDGYLYIGMGDGGSSLDPDNRAQNINDLLGKILRIDVDHTNPPALYSSPSTNPFFGSVPGRDEIYVLGLRNPWRFSFDSATGDLYVGDVGQNQVEEADLVTLGGNYGWRSWEGNVCTGLSPDTGCTGAGFIFPFVTYTHGSGRCSITGGYVYRGTAGSLPVGSYVYADYCSGEIFLYPSSPGSVLLDTTFHISSFGEDEAGEIYVVNLDGTIERIVSATPPGCSYAINPTSASFGVSASGGTVSVTAPAGCPWTAVSNDTWIVMTSGASGSGNGTVSYSVAQYTLKRKFRTGTITIAGQTFSIRQSR
jgi:glucose/arabinose dehydrogenase